MITHFYIVFLCLIVNIQIYCKESNSLMTIVPYGTIPQTTVVPYGAFHTCINLLYIFAFILHLKTRLIYDCYNCYYVNQRSVVIHM